MCPFAGEILGSWEPSSLCRSPHVGRSSLSDIAGGSLSNLNPPSTPYKIRLGFAALLQLFLMVCRSDRFSPVAGGGLIWGFVAQS